MSYIAAGNTTTTSLTLNADTTGNLIFTTGGANTTALTLSNAQVATFSGNVTAQSVTTTSSTGSVNSINTFGFKNRIINGNMVIDQRNAGVISTPASGAYTLDRWYAQTSSASKISVQQVSGGPAGFTKYLAVTVASAVTVGASDFFNIAQAIEGYNIADLGWGAAGAATVTLSFWVYSNITGSFGGSLQNTGQATSYPFLYTISSANTWTQISLTIPGPTIGTWNTTNGIGILVKFSLGAGQYNGTAGSWSNNLYLGATGEGSIMASTSNYMYFTGVQLESGSQATSFDFRDYGRELMLCQRYYEVSGQLYGSPAAAGFGYVTWSFKVDKRTSPTVTYGTSSNVTTGAIAVGSVNSYVAATSNPLINSNSTAVAEL